MRKLYIALTTLALGSALINSHLSATADTQQVRCDFYNYYTQPIPT